VFHVDVAKGRSRCCNIAKVDLDVADIVFKCCGCYFFNVADVIFLVLQRF
jgi:hypothetical protein